VAHRFLENVCSLALVGCEGIQEDSIATLIFTPTLDGGEWSASCPSCCFTSRKESPSTHWI